MSDIGDKDISQESGAEAQTQEFEQAQSARYQSVRSAEADKGNNAGDPVKVTKSTNLTAQAYGEELERAQHQPWNATLKGRAAIRLISRGLFGAGFFALASNHARVSMRDFRPGEKPTRFLHYVANGIDHFLSRPIEKAAAVILKDEAAAKRFVTFRPTKFHYGTKDGCTLGHEMVSLTYDFASMSFGDAIGRDVAEGIDPSVHHSWVDRAGHINYPQILKNTGKSIWKYFTYSAGEDFAVSLPYAFFVRWQRNQIDKVSPGFGYDSDRRLNGGSFKMNDTGDIVGTYGLEGALDLQSRFTVYNMGTLMFREGYIYAGKHLKNWYRDGMKLPHGPESLSQVLHTAVDVAGGLSRWALRDMVKATIYMTPAVPAFWMFRTPQHKYHGVFIHPERGMMGFGKTWEKLQGVNAHEIIRTTNRYRPVGDRFSENTETFFSKSDEFRKVYDKFPVANPFKKYGERSAEDGLVRIDPFKNTYGYFDSLINPIGKANDDWRLWSHKPIDWLEKRGVTIDQQRLRPKKVTNMFINASAAYTPYFFMKNDVMAYNLDNAKMDMAIERTIDGATHFSPSEIKEGLGEIWASMQTWKAPHGVPFKDTKREIAAQKAICDDESPPDGQNFYANSRCFDQALQNIELQTNYHHDVDTEKFVERLKDSRKRSQGMMDQFKKDEAQSFVDRVQPEGKTNEKWADEKDVDASFANKEKHRKAQSLDDFPDINTTLH